MDYKIYMRAVTDTMTETVTISSQTDRYWLGDQLIETDYKCWPKCFPFLRFYAKFPRKSQKRLRIDF